MKRWDVKRWDAFCSHSKRAGDRTPALVRAVKMIMEGRGHKMFYDEDDLDDITLETLQVEIAASAVFLVFVDEVTFDSEWCQQEIAFAAAEGVPIFTLIDKDRYPKEVWRSTMAEHGVEGKSIVEMWHDKLGADLWKTSANHCFGAGSKQVIWYSSDRAGREAALGAIEQHIAAANWAAADPAAAGEMARQQAKMAARLAEAERKAREAEGMQREAEATAKRVQRERAMSRRLREEQQAAAAAATVEVANPLTHDAPVTAQPRSVPQGAAASHGATALSRSISDLRQQVDEAQAKQDFAECAKLQERLEAAEAHAAELAGLERQLQEANAARRFGECDTLQKKIDAVRTPYEEEDPSTPEYAEKRGLWFPLREHSGQWHFPWHPHMVALWLIGCPITLIVCMISFTEEERAHPCNDNGTDPPKWSCCDSTDKDSKHCKMN
jgi:hypothetical protein